MEKTNVLVFMAANNNLKSVALNSINEMEKATSSLDGDLFVLVKTSGYRSDLIKIKYDITDNIVSDTVLTYGLENTSDPAFLKKVIEDTRAQYPSNSFGLVLWSHGTSWYPSKKNPQPRPILTSNHVQLKSFGYDRGASMDITQLNKFLPKDLKFILFDACSMGSLEVVYELKDNADYIIASPTETLSYGFPYNKIVPLLFGNVDSYKKLCQVYMNSYTSRSGIYRSASVALVKTKELREVASSVKNFMGKIEPNGAQIKRDGVQRLDFDANSPVKAYDFLNFMEINFNKHDYFQVEQAFNRAVVFFGNTDTFLGENITKFSGLSIYLPVVNDTNLEYYKQLAWSRDTEFQKAFGY
jgi:hypothetical protein